MPKQDPVSLPQLIAAPDEHARPGTGDVLVRRADRQVDLADLEGARLLEEPDA